MRERWQRWLAAALCWTIASHAGATDLWDRLGPARIGATRVEIAELTPIVCSAAGEEQVCTAAAAGEIFAGVPVAAVELRFAQERLIRATVRLSNQHYEALRSFLNAQFGVSDDRSFRARGGMAAAEFEAGVHLWARAGVSVVLEQFAGKIDRSVLTYGSGAAMADLVRSKTSYPRGTRRDL